MTKPKDMPTSALVVMIAQGSAASGTDHWEWLEACRELDRRVPLRFDRDRDLATINAFLDERGVKR